MDGRQFFGVFKGKTGENSRKKTGRAAKKGGGGRARPKYRPSFYTGGGGRRNSPNHLSQK